MSASQEHISDGTPMGANLIGEGATFRVWAPAARRSSSTCSIESNSRPTSG